MWGNDPERGFNALKTRGFTYYDCAFLRAKTIPLCNKTSFISYPNVLIRKG